VTFSNRTVSALLFVPRGVEGSPLYPSGSCPNRQSPGFIPARFPGALALCAATRSTSRKGQVVWSRHATAAADPWNMVLCYPIEHCGNHSEVRPAATMEKTMLPIHLPSPPSRYTEHWQVTRPSEEPSSLQFPFPLEHMTEKGSMLRAEPPVRQISAKLAWTRTTVHSV